ncbi:uncharacterized protein LOC128581116 [Nycticebus coucang]|uniref:uncharacterized protein LOC128581116 n=1 Tax=Nycticebus coucang TaxID=9470 RepID=UPI00234C8212|nr:uncharacterized protein LOC128581116 [Nycticebus coucang]
MRTHQESPETHQRDPSLLRPSEDSENMAPFELRNGPSPDTKWPRREHRDGTAHPAAGARAQAHTYVSVGVCLQIRPEFSAGWGQRRVAGGRGRAIVRSRTESLWAGGAGWGGLPRPPAPERPTAWGTRGRDAVVSRGRHRGCPTVSCETSPVPIPRVPGAILGLEPPPVPERVRSLRQTESSREPARPRGAGQKPSGRWKRSREGEREGRESEELAAEGTADCAEPMATAGRGGTKFPSANDAPEFTEASLAFPQRQGQAGGGVVLVSAASRRPGSGRCTPGISVSSPLPPSPPRGAASTSQLCTLPLVGSG